MKVKEELSNIKALDSAGLKAHLLVLLKDKFELRMKKQGGQLTDTSVLRKSTKAIARVKTMIAQQQVSGK